MSVERGKPDKKLKTGLYKRKEKSKTQAKDIF
jgi:hypothetical protein